MAGKKHVHKYHRVNVAGTEVWGCALADCTHYMPKHMENMVHGKKSICWNCDAEFKLDAIALKSEQPRCIECRTGNIDSAIEQFLSNSK